MRAARCRRRHAGNGGFGGAGGAAAGILRSRGRHIAAPAFVLCASLIGLYAPADYPGPLIPALAALLYVLAPEAWLAALGETLFRAPPRSVQGEATRALNALSAAFGELAAGVANLPDEQAVLLTMRARLCDACPNYARCWAGEDGRAVRLFCQTLRDAACEGEAAEEVPPDLLRACRRGERLREVAMQEAGKARLRRDADRCAGEMFRQAERILGDLARTRVRPREPPRLDMRWGASARSRTPGTPSGDAHLLRPLPDGRLMALICDGMGTGEAAREESERAVRLIWRFLAARVEPEAALQAANALLIRRGAGDMFATVDLCIIDARAGRARFWKLAASRSLLVREGEVRVIEGGRLPLGVIEGVTGTCEEVDVREGDVIVMGSDGAMEAGEGALEDALRQAWGAAPGQAQRGTAARGGGRGRGRTPGRYDRGLHRRDLGARALRTKRMKKRPRGARNRAWRRQASPRADGGAFFVKTAAKVRGNGRPRDRSAGKACKQRRLIHGDAGDACFPGPRRRHSRVLLAASSQSSGSSGSRSTP